MSASEAVVSRWQKAAQFVIWVLQGVALTLLVLLLAVAAGSCLLAAFGVIPWLDIAVSYDGQLIPNAGMAAQLAFTAFCLTLIFFLPAHARMVQLERSHRHFSISLDDIARAYYIAHSADRAGVFTLSEEFDAMRERLGHLRKHPDLGHLEPELLEASAQMSFAARDLAQTYSDRKVARAKAFLKQRQEELEHFRETLALARHSSDELKRWLGDIEAEERVVEKQLKRLDADLQEVLPKLGYAFETHESTVIPLPSKAVKEISDQSRGS